MQITLRVTTNQLFILGKGHVAFNDSSAHASGGLIGLLGMFRELQRSAAMADRKIRLSQRDFATLFEGSFERTGSMSSTRKYGLGPT